MAQGRNRFLKHGMRLKAEILEGDFAVIVNRTWNDLVKKKYNKTVGHKE